MTRSGVFIDAPALRARERRVHEDQRRPKFGRGQRGQHGAVEAGDGRTSEKEFQLLAPAQIELVEVQFLDARQHADERAVAGTRLEDDIPAPRLRGDHRQGCKVCRGRKLLEADLILASDGLGRQGVDQVGDRGNVGALNGPESGQVKCKSCFQ